MDAKKFLRIKPKDQLASQPVVQPLPNSELEAKSQVQKESIVQPPQTQKLVDRAKTKSDPELQLPQEPVGYLESLATIEREESIGGSGWGYSQLIKEFRNSLTCD